MTPLPHAAEPPGARAARLLERLARLHPRGIDLSLERMWALLERLGHPERRLPPVVHVAGTNGKGSTVAYMRAGLEAAGRRVHAYTSPHLVRFNERIRLAGREIGDDELADVLADVERRNGGAPATPFEAQTAAAFLAFAQVPADLLLLETGLGGRLDATNVVDPRLVVLTPVSLDHEEYLGHGLAAIAGEKAGILKAGRDAVSAPQAAAAAEVLVRRARALAAPLALAGVDWRFRSEADGIVVEDDRGRLELPLPALAGTHQHANAALAATALRRLGPLAPQAPAIRAGIAGARWPARLQRLADGRLARLAPGRELWLDGGHNPDAGAALAAWAAGLADGRPLRLVVGMLARKDCRAFLAPFRGVADDLRALDIPGEPACRPAGEIAAIAAAAGIRAVAAADIAAALADAPADARVLVCGSLYLAGAVLAGEGAGA